MADSSNESREATPLPPLPSPCGRREAAGTQGGHPLRVPGEGRGGGNRHDAHACLIDLLRHGEPEGGVKFRGWVDDPLSETGWGQMRASVGEACHWDAVVTSPLRRCAEFARELAGKHGLAVEIDERFKEMGFGDWEGMAPAAVAGLDADRLENFWRDPVSFPPPGGESLTAVQARVAAGWRDLLARHRSRRVLLVCHGGVIRLVLAQALGIPLPNLFRLHVPFAALSRVRVDGEGESALPQLVFLGGRPG